MGRQAHKREDVSRQATGCARFSPHERHPRPPGPFNHSVIHRPQTGESGILPNQARCPCHPRTSGEKGMRVGLCRERCRRHDGVCLTTVMGRQAHKREDVSRQATGCARFSPHERHPRPPGPFNHSVIHRPQTGESGILPNQARCPCHPRTSMASPTRLSPHLGPQARHPCLSQLSVTPSARLIWQVIINSNERRVYVVRFGLTVNYLTSG